MRTVAVIQARLGSTRLPGKVLYELAGRPMISFMVERVRRVPELDDIVLATGEGAENDALEKIARSIGISIFRGPENDVLSRFLGAARANDADVVVRLTGDCPLADPEVISDVIAHRAASGFDYCTNVKPPTWPDGLDVSVFTTEALARADTGAELCSEREHVVPWMWRTSTLEGGDLLRAGNVPAPEDMSGLRWTVDDARDYLMLRALADKMGHDALLAAGWRDIRQCQAANPEIVALNAGAVRDEGLARSRAMDRMAGGR